MVKFEYISFEYFSVGGERVKHKLNIVMKITAAMLAALLALPSVSCAAPDERESIVCSSYVIYDWVINVLGEDVEGWNIRLLGAKGADIHSYQPTVRDIAAAAECRVFIRNGGQSETWADKMRFAADNEDMIELSLCETMESLLCHEDEDSHAEHSHDTHAHDGHSHEYDEHIWLSFEYARESISLIADALSEARPERAEDYWRNAESYNERVLELEGEYAALANSRENKTVILCDPDPFHYLWKFMGIECEAAYEGCSAESEANFAVVSRLSRKIDECSAGYVLVCESSDEKIANAVISATKNKNAKILSLDSMQSAVIGDAGFIEMAERNLEVLKTALG